MASVDVESEECCHRICRFFTKLEEKFALSIWFTVGGHLIDTYSDVVLSIEYAVEGQIYHFLITLLFVLGPAYYITFRSNRRKEYCPIKKGKICKNSFVFTILFLTGTEIIFSHTFSPTLSKVNRFLFESKNDVNDEYHASENEELKVSDTEFSEEEKEKKEKQKQVKIRKRQIEILNMQLITVCLEDAPQLTFQLCIALEKGMSQNSWSQYVSMITSLLCLSKIIWSWDISWTESKRGKFSFQGKVILFGKWFFWYAARIIAVAVAGACEPIFKIITIGWLVFHQVVHWVWYFQERRYKMVVLAKEGYHLKHYSIMSHLLKSLEASALNLYTPRADKYRFDILGLKDHVKCFKIGSKLPNVLITSIMLIVENFLILFVPVISSNTIVEGKYWLLIGTFISSCLGFVCIMIYKSIKLFKVNKEIEPNFDFRLRDIGKIQDYLQVEKVSEPLRSSTEPNEESSPQIGEPQLKREEEIVIEKEDQKH